MSEQKKPREFWIVPDNDTLWIKSDFNPEQYADQDYFKAANPFHVIEISALTELQAKYDALELVYKDKQTEMNELELELQALTVKHAALLEQVEKLVQALEIFKADYEDSKKRMPDMVFRDYAGEALADYEAWKKENLK